MIDIFLHKVIPGVIRLSIYISIGILLGVILEYLKVMQKLAFVVKPLLRLGKLPEICGSAFVSAFASPKTAQAMLSSAYVDKTISRRSLVIGAVCCSFPSTLLHLKIAGPLLITVLGGAGISYVAFIVGSGFTVLIGGLISGYILYRREVEEKYQMHNDVKEKLPKERSMRDRSHVHWLKKLWSRWWKLMTRVLIVALPVFTIIALVNRSGVLKDISKVLPGSLQHFFSAESLLVIAAQMTSTTNSIAVAKDFLDSNALTYQGVFITLVAGYCLSLPIRTLRRNAPSMLSIFPGRNGIFIVLFSQGIRFLIALTILITYILVKIGV